MGADAATAAPGGARDGIPADFAAIESPAMKARYMRDELEISLRQIGMAIRLFGVDDAYLYLRDHRDRLGDVDMLAEAVMSLRADVRRLERKLDEMERQQAGQGGEPAGPQQ